MAFGARPVRRIEAERARLELRDGDAAIRTCEFLGIDVLFSADDGNCDQAAREPQRRLNRLLEALRDAIFQQEPVNDDFDRVIFAAIERNRLVEIHQVAVDARADEAFLGVLLELFLVFAFAAANDRSEHHDPLFGLERENGLHNLLGGLPGDGFAAVRAMRRTNRAIDDAQVVVDFRDRAHGRPGRSGGRFLLDGNRRRQALDRVHVGAFHLVEKLARVGGERFDVAALAFGIQSVECERGFAGTGKAGNDGQRIPGNLEIDVLEIVLPRAANNDFLEAHVIPMTGKPPPYGRELYTVGKLRPR